MKIKKLFKALTLTSLLIVFTVLVIAPANIQAQVVDQPGLKNLGGGGPACECPAWPYYDCKCQVELPN